MGRLTFHASAGHARDDALGQEEVEDEGRQEDDDDRGEHTRPVAGVLHGIDHGIKADSNATHLIGIAEDEGDKIFVPDVNEIKDADGDDAGLRHGQHDFPEGSAGSATVDGGGLFKSPGNVREEPHQEDRGVGNVNADIEKNQGQLVCRDVVQDIQTCDQGKEREDNHHDGHSHRRYKKVLNQLVACKVKAGERISRRRTDQNQQEDGAERIEKGVEEDGGDIGVHPRLFIVLKVQAAGEQAVGKDLSCGGKTGQKDPAKQHHRKENP